MAKSGQENYVPSNACVQEGCNTVRYHDKHQMQGMCLSCFYEKQHEKSKSELTEVDSKL